EVIGIMIHVVPLIRLRGAAVTTPVMRDDAIAVIDEEHHLPVPVIRRERPTVAEHNGLTLAPVLVENFRTGARLDRRHLATPSLQHWREPRAVDRPGLTIPPKARIVGRAD